MKEFLKKMTEWVLDKEEEAAKHCKIDLDDLQRQIDFIVRKRDDLKRECEENLQELEHILKRLETIKARESICKRD
ncbi:restriction endonuclease subunit S domain-containing protein [Hydrogenimonas cancrithermarum]|uniref:Uncharacterized protein n=1 Tax=Hydrogenimonas cancrithermarum TaxID=2993563 RepID=A0ABM8FJC8_9BACT|nr:hypothetical protein [Hydrogenimonas cancrithermarum]BDY11727.1 hypothetical protein HCR_00390 [Hydrogenimonas cancrithermarum]